eukprot:Nk52_evm18s490 gene=Nk52_evmTU18s490
MGILDVIKSTKRPHTTKSVCGDLQELGIRSGDSILVHCSMREIGWVCGGAQAVVMSLEKVIGDEGNIMMPAFSAENSEPEFWCRPPVPTDWFDEIRETMPPFDVDLTPTRCMGIVAETFRASKGFRKGHPVVRSDHPTSSFCCSGPDAEDLVGSHPISDELGLESPLGRFYSLDKDCYIVLIGVDFTKNTSLHLAEYIAEWKGKELVDMGSRVYKDSVVKEESEWKIYQAFDVKTDDFLDIQEDFIDAWKTGSLASNAVREGLVGSAKTYMINQKVLVEYACTWLTNHRV